MLMPARLWLIRHGETEWSRSGAHTGRSDIPLTPQGEQDAGRVGQYLNARPFRLVLTSPLQRARDTCRLAGYGGAAVTDPDLREWDYGIYEGRTTAEIQREIPGWSVWDGTVPGGESIEDVAARAGRAIARAEAAGGEVALFSHAHFLRILAACWVELPPRAARFLALDTASVSVLGWERETRAISRWNRSFTPSET
jgi:broad specificity phosphatase PhoE